MNVKREVSEKKKVQFYLGANDSVLWGCK